MKKELEWKVPEYPQYDRGRPWFIGAGIFGIGFLIYAVITGNFLFSVIIVLGVAISLISSWKKPEIINFKMFDKGVILGEAFHPWESFQSYWIVNEDGQKNLGLDLKNWLKSDLYVPVKENTLEDIEKFVSGFLKKNKERKEEPLSYFLGRKLKI